MGPGVEGEWIWIKAQEQARRRHDEKRREKQKTEEEQSSEDEYTSQLDDQRCLYYVHGGGVGPSLDTSAKT